MSKSRSCQNIFYLASRHWNFCYLTSHALFYFHSASRESHVGPSYQFLYHVTICCKRSIGSFLILVLFFLQSLLAMRCPQLLIACNMVVLGIHQRIHTTLSADSRVLTAIKPLVLTCEDASRMDFGVEESFLANVSTREARTTSLIK